jgi:hypothetical protein
MRYLFAAVLIFSSSLLKAQQSNWNTYNQNGYNLELPDYFLPVKSDDPSTDVFNNTNNKDITLKIENKPIDKLSFNSKYITEIGNSGVTYKLIKDSVYTVVYTANDVINYHKSFFSNNMVHSLIIAYPNKQKTQFDLVLQRIGRSFK